MAKTKLYEVELLSTPASGAKRTMWRGGRQFEVKVPQVLELTNEEVKVYEDDNRFTLSETDGSSVSESESSTASDGESDSSSSDSETETDATTEDSDNEDSSSDEAEEASDDTPEAPSVEKLVKDNSRKELNALALEANVENPDREDWTKTEVAQAIVDAQASNAESEATS